MANHDPDDLTRLSREEAIARLQSLKAFITHYWGASEMLEAYGLDGQMLTHILAGTCPQFPAATVAPEADLFNGMHLALKSIAQRAGGILRSIEIAGLSDTWAHRVSGIEGIAQRAIADLGEPTWPAGPPSPPAPNVPAVGHIAGAGG